MSFFPAYMFVCQIRSVPYWRGKKKRNWVTWTM